MESESTGVKNQQKSSNFLSTLRIILPSSKNAFGERKPWYKLPLAKRIAYFVVSLLIAVLMWGFVLMTQNPDRERTFTNIKPYFESGAEADLIARQLTVVGSLSDILEKVSVTVSAPLTDVSKVTENDVTATVSLNDVSRAGTYTLKVKATSTVGAVTRIEPSTVEVIIDDFVSNSVPISYEFVGALPDGYWHDEPMLLDTTAKVEGAKQDVVNVASAVCYIDLTDLTESVNRLYQLDLLDKDGNVLDKSVFKKSIPAVTVRMTVLPHKSVPVVYELNSEDFLSDSLEIENVSLSIESLDIAALPAELSELDEIVTEPIKLTNITKAGTYQFTLLLKNMPESGVIIGGVSAEDVKLTIVVVEKKISQFFPDCQIIFVGESELYNYHYSFPTVGVTVTGTMKLMQAFTTGDLEVIANVDGKGPGEYDILLEYKISNYDLFGELEVKLMEIYVHVSVSETTLM